MGALRAPVGVAVAAAVVLASLASRVGDWAVMTDELLYERLAISIGDSFVPRLHAEVVGVYALLYPLLLAPVFALVEQPAAVVVAHAWNGVLFASAAIPAYLLARRVPVPPGGALAAAIFTVAVPWSVIAGFLMTEAAAYPAFLWAALAIQRAVATPSGGRDAAALAAIAVAALARPQLAVLALVLPAVVIATDARALRSLLRRRVLFGAYAAVLAVLALLAALGSLGAALGSYAPTLEEGTLLSRAALRSAAVHLDVLAVAIGLVPLLVGGGWALGALVRPPADREARSLAALLVATLVALTLEAGSVVVRFGLGVEVKDRYLFYVAPLLFVATAAALADARWRTAGLLAATAFFVLTVGWERFEPVFGVNVDSPASSTHELLTRESLALGLQPGTLVTLAAGALAVALVLAPRLVPREPLALALLGGTTLFCALESGYLWGRLLGSSNPVGRPAAVSPPAERAWVDRAVPDGAAVGMLAYSVGQDFYPSAFAWWDVEFWNATVTHAYEVGGWFAYTPDTFPRPLLRVDFATGRLLGDPPAYLVRTTLDARFAPAGRRVGSATDLEVVRLTRPPRARWATRGLAPDGWTRAGEPAVLRVYAAGEVDVRLTLNSPEVEVPRGYDVAGLTGTLGSTEVRELAFRVCVPTGNVAADVPIRVEGATPVRRIATRPPFANDFRFVGVRLSRIAASPTGRSC